MQNLIMNLHLPCDLIKNIHICVQEQNVKGLKNRFVPQKSGF